MIKSARFSLLFVFSILIFCSLVLTTKANAQTATQPQTNSFAPNLKADVPRDQHSYVQSLMIETMASAICQLSGVDPIREDKKCLGMDPQSGKIGFVDNSGGAIGLMGNLMTYTFTPPISSTQYIRYLSSNFGFAKSAYAAEPSPCANNDKGNGIGFCGIEPLLPMWIAMRNIAYLIFVLIFVVIGLAIMLRVKIDPRTVMTVQNQIPKIIIGIILVTFSFAIAGFLIDMMYVSIYVVGGVLASAAPDGISIELGKLATSSTPIDAIGCIGTGDCNGLGFNELAGQGASTINNLVGGIFSYNPTPGFFSIFSDPVGFLRDLAIGLFVSIAILIALLYVAIKLFISLLIAYISILLDIVFAPFWFLAGLLPGSSMGVGAWFRDILGNLAVFPTAIAMFILAEIFFNIIDTSGTTGPGAALFSAPMVGGIASTGAEAFAGLVALGFLFMTPDALKIVKSAVKAPNLQLGSVLKPAGVGVGYPINVAKGVKHLHGKSDEIIMTEKGYQRRSWAGAIFGLNKGRGTPINPTAGGGGGSGHATP